MPFLAGREYEQQLLLKLQNSGKPEFVAVYGRRRVGKTFLIRQVFDNAFTFHFTGMANASLQQQLANFNIAFSRIDKKGFGKTAESWLEAFAQLIDFLEQDETKRKIVFIDELPWLDTPSSGFIPALEHFWNSWAATRNDILFIVCGSAASWMISKLINNKGGLHNRVTQRIHLKPFTLAECEVYFKMRNAAFDRYQLLQLYMVMGGIPFYLEQVDTGRSAAQNIDSICFTQTGLLQNEFNNLYASLFKKADKHIAIIEALATKLKGITREELLQITGLPNGGGTTRLLTELEASNFILRYRPFEKKERNSLYQVADFYSLFYLKFIKNANVADENFWINGLDSPAYRAWSGYAFEQVCLAHVNMIKNGLGISGVQSNSSSWIGGDGKHAAQIDLLIDRRDQVINVCEMKFSMNTFSITKKYADDIRNKLGVFKAATGTKKSLYFTMITTFGLLQNDYAHSLVQNSLTMDVLFE